jgi:hypothetical protein
MMMISPWRRGLLEKPIVHKFNKCFASYRIRNINYGVHKSPSLVPILHHMHPVRDLLPTSALSSYLLLDLPSSLFPSEFTVIKKTIPLQAWTGPEDSRRLRLPDIKIFGTRKW